MLRRRRRRVDLVEDLACLCDSIWILSESGGCRVDVEYTNLWGAEEIEEAILYL